MINNYDSHGKNISVFFDNKTSKFTPAYDLVNVAMFPQFNHVLALTMGDELLTNNSDDNNFSDEDVKYLKLVSNNIIARTVNLPCAKTGSKRQIVQAIIFS